VSLCHCHFGRGDGKGLWQGRVCMRRSPWNICLVETECGVERAIFKVGCNNIPHPREVPVNCFGATMKSTAVCKGGQREEDLIVLLLLALEFEQESASRSCWHALDRSQGGRCNGEKAKHHTLQLAPLLHLDERVRHRGGMKTTLFEKAITLPKNGLEVQFFTQTHKFCLNRTPF
jgi:hypothetical protein